MTKIPASAHSNSVPRKKTCNHKTRRGSWNLVSVTLEDTSFHATHIFLGKVCHIILKQDWSFCYIKPFTLIYFIVFPAASCWLKALGICIEGLFCMRLDGMKDIQPVQSCKSICIQSLNPKSYTRSRDIRR